MRSLLCRLATVTLIMSAATALNIGAATADPGFRLPFEQGKSFRITQGPPQHAGGPYPDYNRHAVDFAMPEGTPVLASAGGSINFEGFDSTGAIQVRIDHGGDRCTQYVHLSRTIIDRGQTVQRGQLIGYSGNTGISSGPHLHWNMVYCSSQRSREVVPTLEMGTSYPVGQSAASQNGAPAPAGRNPIGHFDVGSSPEPGRLRVRGWAFDPDSPTAPVDIHVYVGAPAGTSGIASRNLGPATVSRPDVARAHPSAGDRHGFDATFDHRGGSYVVHVYAINRGGTGGNNTLLERRTVSITDPDPKGHLDSVTSPQGGELHLRGWTFDPSNTTASLNYHVYVGAPSGSPGAESFSFGPADVSRPDVDKVHQGAGTRHGIDQTFAVTKSGRQTVYLYGINVGYGSNKLLGSATVDIAPGPPVIRPTGRPALRGVPRVGKTLKARPTTWNVAGVLARYEWLRNGKVIPGAASGSYKLRTADKGKKLRVRIVAVKPGYTTGVSASTPTKRVLPTKRSARP